MAEIIIPITPVPKGRPRFYCGHAVTPKRTREYEDAVRMAWTEGMVEGKNLVAWLSFIFSVPKSYSKKKREDLLGKPYAKTPDLDNLVKSTLDALSGKAFDNDARIVVIQADKYYGENPKVIVRINSLDDDDLCLGDVADALEINV